MPTRGQMIATEPLAERIFECPHYGRHGFDYWQQTPDGRILAGGFRDWALESEFTADEQHDSRRSRARSSRSSPSWSAGRSRSSTAGQGSSDWCSTSCPSSDSVPGEDQVWVAGGYSGHGNVLGLLCGELVAQAMLGREAPELALFDPARLL